MNLRRRIVFVGAYGIQNAGDDAPLLVLTRGLRARHPEVEFEFTVLARHPDPLLERAAGARFLPNPEYASRAESAGKFFRGLNPGDERGDLLAAEQAIRECDLVVAGAGNVLVDLTLDLFRGPLALLALYAFLADLHARPLFLYGISAGPLRSQRGRELAAWIVRRAACVGVRDEESRALLASLAPTVASELLSDPVLGLVPCDDAAFERALASEGLARRGARPRLALALRDLAFLGHDGAGLRATLAQLAQRFELLFVPQCTDRDCDDRLFAEQLARSLPAASVRLVRQRHAPDVLMRFYGTAEATLATRLHGAVFSAMAGTPVVGLAYLPKVRGFLERVGLGSTCFALEQAVPGTLVPALEAARVQDRAALAARCQGLTRGVQVHVERAAALLGLAAPGARRAA